MSVTVSAAERPRVRVPAGSAPLSTSADTAFMHLRALGQPAVAAAPPAAPAPAPGADQDRHKDGKFKAAPKSDEEEDAQKDPDEDEDPGDETDDGDDKSDDEESSGKRGKKRASARRRERARCASIFASEHAAANVEMAAHLAFQTSLTRSQAIALLAKAPPGSGGLAAAMQRIPNPRVGPGANAEAPTDQAIATGWDKAFGKNKR